MSSNWRPGVTNRMDIGRADCNQSLKIRGPSLLFSSGGGFHLSRIRIGIAAVIVAGAGYWGWTALEKNSQHQRIAKICDRFIKTEVLDKAQLDSCQTDAKVRIAADDKLIRERTLYILKLVSSSAAKLEQQLEKLDVSSFPTVASDQDIGLSTINGKDLPERFRVELHTVFVDDPEGDVASWTLTGTRVDNGKLEILDLDGIGPAYLKNAQACVQLWGVGPKAACRAVAYVELDKADGTLGSSDNYIAVGLKITPPTVEMIDQAIAERKEPKSSNP